MAGLDDLLNEIPTQQIANQLGADEGEVNSAIQTLVPLLVGGLQHNAQNPDHAADIENAANNQAASGLLDGGVSVDQVNQEDGANAISKIFGGNSTDQVAAALAGGGVGNSGLIQKLLPILAPIVLAYIGKQLGGGLGQAQAQPQAQAPAQAGGGGLGDVLGNILGGALGGGAAGGNNNPLGSILGNVLGGALGGGASGTGNNPLGEILGGLLGGRK
ncbi:DUF937 domain-containing protein [Mycobacterium sp. OTB74]|jgi:hypothetical protein|uniref:DUF937 domain-containing protein n=1 Tax=Mycobacterium sp. OTB74 TaxID=1853452 RepID=UPI00247415CC|nr:DUF937 domain-containing protein [Mycobacterium sp. OTB74]MDH6246909.1 hypothetical protein [Mycobacterium sp. OTB74]